MATDHNFRIKNGLSVSGTEVIDSNLNIGAGGAANSSYDLIVYSLARFQGTANFVSGNPIQIGGTTLIDSSRRIYPSSIQGSGAISFLNGSAGNSGSGAQGISVRDLYAGTTYANRTGAAGTIDALNGFKVAGTTVITSGRGLANVTLSHGTGGARFETNNWHYSTDNHNRFYFEATGRTFYKATSHQFRNVGSNTVFNINSTGGIHIASGGDSLASSTEYIKAGGNVILSNSRHLTVASGAVSGKFAVMNAGVHASYDFYNNGTSYFNGSVIIDDLLNLTGTNRKLNIAGTTVIDANRNLTNIQSLTIDSGGQRSDTPEGQFFKWYLTGQGTDQNWKKVATITIGTGLYKALGMKVLIQSQLGNFGNTGRVQSSEMNITYYRSAGTQDDQNNAIIYGKNPTSHNLRVMKTATGTYELQLKQTANYRDAIVHIEILSTNGGTIVMQDGSVNGSTSGTEYTPSFNVDAKNLFPGVIETQKVFADATTSNTDPKYTFNGDADTGLGYISSNAVGLIAGASRKFYVTNTNAYFQNLSGGTTFNEDVSVPNINVADDIKHTGDSDTNISFEANSIIMHAGGSKGFSMDSSAFVVNQDSLSYDFRVESNGQTHMLFVDGSADRVGIGTNAPTQTFNVYGRTLLDAGNYSATAANLSEANSIYALSIKNRNAGATLNFSGNSSYVSLQAQTSTTAAKNIALNPFGGRVGIGTTSPGAPFQVNATAMTGADIAYFANSNGVRKAKFHLSGAGDGQLSLLDGNNNIDVLISATGNSYFNAGGNVGIGTTSPGSTLDVHGNTNLGSDNIGQQYTTTLSGFSVTANGTDYYGSYGSLLLNSNQNYTSTSRPYMITNALGANKFAIISGTNATTDPTIGTGGAITSGSARLVIDNAGNVGIGTTNPSNALHVISDDTTGAVKIARSSNQDQALFLRGGIGSGEGRLAAQYTLELRSGLSGSNAYDLLITTASGTAIKVDAGNSNRIQFNNAYKFPTSDGSSGQVLQTDGSGQLSFASVSTGGTITGVSNFGNNNRILTADGATTINAESNLTYDGARLTLFTNGAAVTSDNAGFTIRQTGTYSDGRYEHRFRKLDEGGGIPLYIDKTTGTAGSHTQIVRFGSYSGHSQEFEVYGNAKVDNLDVSSGGSTSQIVLGKYDSTDQGILYLTGSTANKQSVLKTTNGNLHIDSASGNNTYINYYTGSGTYFGGGSTNVVAVMGSDGDLWKGSGDNSGSKYWHASNDGSGSGLDADTIDGLSFIEHQGVSKQINITVDGDSNKYYPVVISGLNHEAGHEVKIERGYAETAPNDWYTSTHKGGLSLRFHVAGASGWGGYPNIYTVDEFGEIYSRICGGMKFTAHTMKFVVWLRGGTATYRIFTKAANASAIVYDDTSSGYTSGSGWLVYDHSNSSYDVYEDLRDQTAADTGAKNEIIARMPVRAGGTTKANQINYYAGGTTLSGGNLYWNDANDGSGSGLDADTLDGQHGSHYTNASNISSGTLSSGRMPSTPPNTYIYGTDTLGAFDSSTFAVNPPRMGFFNINNSSAENPAGFGYWQGLHFRHNNQSSTWGWQLAGTYNTSYPDLYFRQVASASRGAWYKLWHTGNDGAGSGLDADTLDGAGSGSFLRSDANDTMSSTLTFGSGSGFDLATFDVYGSMRVIRNNKSGSDGMYIGYLNSNSGATRIFGGGQGSGGIRVNGSGNNDVKIGTSSGTAWHSANDGSGSGLDADLLDGQHASAFLTDGSIYTPKDHIRSLGTTAFTSGSNPNITTAQYISEMESDGAFDSYSSVFKTSWSYAGNYNLSDAGSFGPTETAGMSHITWTDNSNDSARGNITVLAIAPTTGGSAGGVYVYNDQGSGYNAGWREIWTSSTDGAGSGLDADLLDGQHASAFLTSVPNHSASLITSGTVAQARLPSPLNSLHSNAVTGSAFSTSSAPDSVLEYQQASGQSDTKLAPSTDWHNSIRLGHGDPYTYYSNTIAIRMTGSGLGDLYTQTISNNNAQGWNKHWHANNDGSGSGLDADLLDGQHGSYYEPASTNLYKHRGSVNVTTSSGGSNSNPFDDAHTETKVAENGSRLIHYTGASASMFTINTGGSASVFQMGAHYNGDDFYMRVRTDSSSWKNWRKLWHNGNDGSGSGLDADKLDGLDSSQFVRSDTSDSMLGNLTVDNGTNTLLNVKCDDSGNAIVRAGGDNQGTGAFEVSQNNGSHGGGISYNGDNSPGFASGETADHITFYRISSGTRTEVFHYPYNSNVVNFNSTPTVGGVGLVKTSDTIAQATNADTVDNLHASSFIRSDAADTATGNITLGASTKIYFGNNTAYGIGAQGHNYRSGYFDTLESGGATDPLELIYYVGNKVNIGPGGNKPMNAGSYQVNGTEVISSGRALGNITGGTFTSGRLNFHTSNVQAPTSSNATTGARLNLYPLGSGRDYTIGIENSHMWFNTDGGYKFYQDGSIRVTFSSGGGIVSTGDVTAFSDERLKTNIKTLDGKKALEMRGVSFEKNGEQGSGVIAQELEKIAPELVHTSDDDMQTKSVAYGNLVGYLIEAIKDQQKQIDELKEKLNIKASKNNT